MPSFPELSGPIGDGAVRLRAAAERDIPEILIAHQDDRDMFRRLGMKRPPSGAELGRKMEEAPGKLASGTGLTLTILQGDSDECVGQIDLQDVDWDHRRAELGIWVVPQARGRHVARRALRLASAWLFDQCGFERVHLLTAPDNEPLVRAARAAGFTHEGVLRGHERERDRQVDRVVLSLLPSDVAPAK